MNPEKDNTFDFCILAGFNYFSRAIALYKSISRHFTNFTLYYITFDEKTYEVLCKMDYPHIIPIPLSKLENNDLLRTKRTRTIPEYYFTLTPFIILHVLKNYKIDTCTYLDADIFFFNSPEILIAQLEGNNAIITEHRHSKQEIVPDTGRFCVQFMPFRNNERGNEILEWWAERCLEWCYLRRENGLWADQGYLEDWTERFSGVHVLNHQGEGLAPWNIKDFKITKDGLTLRCTDIFTKSVSEVIYYHFQGLLIYTNNTIALQGSRYFSKDVFKYIYTPYINELISVQNELTTNNIFDDPHGRILPKKRMFLTIKNIYRTIHPQRSTPFKISKIIRDGKTY